MYETGNALLRILEVLSNPCRLCISRRIDENMLAS